MYLSAFKDLAIKVLDNLFRSVFVVEDTSNIPAFSTQVAQHMLEFNITEEMVFEKLARLNVSKSCGPDGVSPWILKQCT